MMALVALLTLHEPALARRGCHFHSRHHFRPRISFHGGGWGARHVHLRRRFYRPAVVQPLLLNSWYSKGGETPLMLPPGVGDPNTYNPYFSGETIYGGAEESSPPPAPEPQPPVEPAPLPLPELR